LFPKHIWENITDPLNFEPWNEPHPANPELTQLIGTGPFYFVEYVPKDHVLLRANPNYFKKLPTATSEEVGSSGGTVSNVAGTSSVEIPPGALTENTTITIEEYPTSEYGGFLINQTDKIVSFGVYKFGPTGTTFETNVTITLTYNETAVDESQLEQLVVYSSDDGVTWYQITIESVDTIENTITIKVHHFSLFVILQPTIYGVLTDEYTFQPIEGVTISILETGASTITDTQGRYSFVNIPDGNYTVEMTVPYGYLTHDAVTKFIEVTTSTEVSFTLYEESWSDGTVPRTIGYWKNWDKHYTPELVQTLIDKVKSASELFDELTIDNIGTYFKINRQSTMETKAQAQLLASWLNIVSAQLRIDIQVDITSISGWETVITDDDGILTVDVLLNQIDKCYVTDADLTKEQWETIKDILDALNNRLLFVT
jgi:ABC-type transport system substrate-binding protein